MKTFFQLKRVSKSFDIIFRLPSFKKRMKKVLKITKKDSSSTVPSPRGGTKVMLTVDGRFLLATGNSSNQSNRKLVLDQRQQSKLRAFELSRLRELETFQAETSDGPTPVRRF